MIQLLLILLILLCFKLIIYKEHYTTSSFDNIIDRPIRNSINLKAEGGNQGIKLTWIQPTDINDVGKYYIYYEKKFQTNESINSIQHIMVHITNNTLLEYYIKGIPNNITYDIYIVYKDNNNTHRYDHKSVTTTEDSPMCLSLSDCDKDKDKQDTEDPDNIPKSNIKQNNMYLNKDLHEISNILIKNRIIKLDGNYTLTII